MEVRRKLEYWLPVVLWMGFIYWMSTESFSAQHTLKVLRWGLHFLFGSVSPKTIFLVHEIVRKSAHVTEYFISGLLLFRAFRGSMNDRSHWHWALFSMGVIVLLALSDEFHQTFISSRTPSMIDVGIDSFGGFLAQCVQVAWNYWRIARPVQGSVADYTG